MISVCLASYNGEKYIKEQIESILSQISEKDEVVISDDGSSDKTLEILKSYKDPRIKILKNNGKKGVIGNFENALNHAMGEYIFLSDQDDIWKTNKVSESIFYLQSYDLVVSDCSIINEKKKIVIESFFKIYHSQKGFWYNFKKNTYLGCCMAFRRDVMTYILPFPNKIAMHDIWIGLNVELNGNPFFINNQLVLYRRHGGNVSSSGEKSRFSFSYKIIYRFQMLYYLLGRKFKLK